MIVLVLSDSSNCRAEKKKKIINFTTKNLKLYKSNASTVVGSIAIRIIFLEPSSSDRGK